MDIAYYIHNALVLDFRENTAPKDKDGSSCQRLEEGQLPRTSHVNTANKYDPTQKRNKYWRNNFQNRTNQESNDPDYLQALTELDIGRNQAALHKLSGTAKPSDQNSNNPSTIELSLPQSSIQPPKAGVSRINNDNRENCKPISIEKIGDQKTGEINPARNKIDIQNLSNGQVKHNEEKQATRVAKGKNRENISEFLEITGSVFLCLANVLFRLLPMWFVLSPVIWILNYLNMWHIPTPFTILWLICGIGGHR